MRELILHWKTNWPKILGSILGTVWMFIIVYLAAKALHG